MTELHEWITVSTANDDGEYKILVDGNHVTTAASEIGGSDWYIHGEVKKLFDTIALSLGMGNEFAVLSDCLNEDNVDHVMISHRNGEVVRWRVKGDRWCDFIPNIVAPVHLVDICLRALLDWDSKRSDRVKKNMMQRKMESLLRKSMWYPYEDHKWVTRWRNHLHSASIELPRVSHQSDYELMMVRALRNYAADKGYRAIINTLYEAQHRGRA